jgi:hypothetical protein
LSKKSRNYFVTNPLAKGTKKEKVGKNPSLNYDETMDTKNTSNDSHTGIPKAVENAVLRLLRPLARLLLSFQITFPVFQQWLKKAYVEIAEKEFPLEGKPQTDTRISLLTGIHRKDIKRLRHEDDAVHDSPENISIGVQLAAHWMGQSEFLDQDKAPLALPFKAQADQPSFERLVEQVCKKDIRARVVLDEWLRLGVVSIAQDEEKHELITIAPGAFVPSHSVDEKAFFLGMNVADHLATATHNVLNSDKADQTQEAKFERCLYYDGLSADSIKELKQLANDQGMAMLHALNERALHLKQQDDQINAELQTQRINIGLYVFDEPDHAGTTCNKGST